MHRPQARGKSRAAIAAALIVVVAASGCSTILNPYVRDPSLDTPSSDLGVGVERLENVIEVAENQRKAYYNAVSERAKMRNALPLILLPLSAMALYRGITTNTDAGRRMVLEMGLLGAAYYSTSNWYLTGPRERIYLAGALALSCAIHAVEPYLAAKSVGANFQRDLGNLDVAIESVDNLQRQLGAQAKAVVAGKALDAQSATILNAEAEIGIAKALVARGKKVSSEGHRIDAQIGNTAGELRFAVQRITDQVDRQIEATDQDPSSVLRAVGGLGKLGADIAHVGALRLDAVGVDQDTGTKGQGTSNPAVAAMEKTRARMIAAEQTLMDAMAAVASFNATMIQAVKNAPRLDSCTVADVAGELVVSPPGDNADLKTGVPFVFRVRAASGIPDAALSGAVGDSSDTAKDVVRILDKTVDGNVRVVRVLQDKPVPGHELVTLDFFALNERGSGASKKVTLTLDTAPAPTSKPAAPAKTPAPARDPAKVGPKNAKNDYETKTLTVGKLMEVQKALKVKVDGDFGPETRGAIGNFVGDKKKDQLSADLVDKILAAPAPANPAATSEEQRIGPQGAKEEKDNQYETKVLTVGALKDIQKKLSLEPTGAFNDATRAAIKRRQGGDQPSGILTPDLAKKIQGG